MASNTVLDNYELLERVLLHLPLRTLLLAQRVNKSWSYVVHRSQNIQRALFLRGHPGPIKLRRQPSKRQPPAEKTASRYVNDKGVVVRPPILNPFLIVRRILEPAAERSIRRALGSEKCVICGVFREMEVEGFLCWRESEDCNKSFAEPVDGSSNMLLTQPPLKETWDFDCVGDPVASIRSEGGVTPRHLCRYGAADRHRIVGQFEDVAAGKKKIWEVPPVSIALNEARTWKRVSRGADGITGFEMLSIMRIRSKEVEDELMKDVGGYSSDEEDGEEGEECESEDGWSDDDNIGYINNDDTVSERARDRAFGCDEDNEDFEDYESDGEEAKMCMTSVPSSYYSAISTAGRQRSMVGRERR